jgi:hypothetical protein
MLGAHWQRRYFRLQGRALYYFKKDLGEPNCGYIPLVNIDVSNMPAGKNVKFGFKIQITNLLDAKMAKRAEYLVQAESDEARTNWIRIIKENRAISLVGQPFSLACSVSPTSPETHLLLPYFFPPLIAALDATGYKTRGIWTMDIPAEQINSQAAYLNLNQPLPMDDIHRAIGVFIHYLKSLPQSLLPASELPTFQCGVTPEKVRTVILKQPAPIRQLLKLLGLHLRKVLEASSQNNVREAALLFIGQFFIKSDKTTSIPPAQLKEVQDQVAQTFLTSAVEIVEDVHQFLEAPTKPILRRARLVGPQAQMGDSILEGSRGLLVSVVAKDDLGWSVAYTTNKRVGLVHESNLATISDEEARELDSGANNDAVMDIVREKAPELQLLFEGMIDETAKLREALEKV